MEEQYRTAPRSLDETCSKTTECQRGNRTKESKLEPWEAALEPGFRKILQQITDLKIDSGYVELLLQERATNSCYA